MLQQRFSRTRTAVLGAVILVGAVVTAGLTASPAAAAPQHSRAVQGSPAIRGHASPAVSSLTTAAIPDDQRLKGDFNGDGKSDVAVLYDYGSANTGFLVMPSTGSSFIGPQVWYLSGAGNWNWSASKPVAGDFNGDGKTDIAVLYDYGYATVKFFVLLSTGHSFAAPQSWYDPDSGSWDGNSSKLTVGDFNGDGKADLAVLYNYGSATVALRVMISTGSSFNAAQSWYTSGSGSWDWNASQLA